MQYTVHFFALLLVVNGNHATQERCTYINYRGKNAEKNAENPGGCANTKACEKNFQIELIDTPPYSTSRIFDKTLQRCCGGCANITYTKQYTNITEVQLSAVASSTDFILPFLGRSSATELYSFGFIPFIDVPCAYYITRRHESPTSTVITACFSLYPLIVISLLAAMISGFIIWSLETRWVH